jgi:hypothetical protein
MPKTIFRWIAIWLLAPTSLFSGIQEPVAANRATVDRYCVTCHNDRLRTAGLTLEKVDVDKVAQGAEVWEKVIRKLRNGQMPPAGVQRPDPATYRSLAAYLETALDREAALNPNPGRPSLRRLNRTEYTNTVRDLLAVEINGDVLLPADDSRFGFDNNGDVLTVSPLLSERYLSAARKISRLAIGDPSVLPSFETYDTPRYLLQDDRISEALPFGSRGGIVIRHQFPQDGEYVIRIRLQRNHRDFIRGLVDAHQLDVRLNGVRIKRFTVGGEQYGKSAPIFSTAAIGDIAQEEYERASDEALEFRFHAKAGLAVVAVTFLKQTSVPEIPLRPRMTQYDFTQYKGGQPGVASVSIGGPFAATGLGDTASRRKILVCRPLTKSEEQPCAGKILSALARRAYRRPAREQDVQTLLSFYDAGRAEGGFEEGIGTALERILVDPEFLFRIERDPAVVPRNGAYRISDIDLASRLSFFLWSSMPDDELLSLAEKGQLKDPTMMEQQVRRMLADHRSNALVSNFAGQWLYLRNLRSVSPDPELFPYFDDNLREAFRQETELFFDSMVREDRTVLDLLSANYTFVNERLAEHYGIPDVYGSRFRRVTLNDPHRGGLLGQGSILTVTSYGNRTSPVIRGKWILENILGAPPPPPPPNVPELRDRNQDGRMLSMRQQMEQHRASAVCASCHKVMDPLGFALENFDATGRWRTTDANTPVDPSGVLPDGTKVDGPAGLRDVLLQHGDEFVTTVTERLLTYALGRGVDYYDAPAIREILREAAPNKYTWSSLILGITKSKPFQMRRSQEP